MNPVATRLTAHIAIDLGAQSCRVSLLRWDGRRGRIEPVHRFENAPRLMDGGLRWDLSKIVAGVERGLRRCAELAPDGIASIGVDGWAVDYVRLDPSGMPLAEPYCYRDERTVAAEKSAHTRCSASRMRDITGVQLLRINTAYQLHADRLANLPAGHLWLNLPEYLLMHLGARPVAEYTNASHSQLLDLQTKQWSAEIFRELALDPSHAPTLVPSGTEVGEIGGELAQLPAFRNTKLIAPACHDTASAIAGIADTDQDWAYISSGTWSLVGTLLGTPCNTTAAAKENFTNLGAVGGRYLFHRNVNGMWLITQCMEAWAVVGKSWNLQELIRAAALSPSPTALLEVDDPDLMLAGRMPERINAQLSRRGFPVVDVSSSNAPQIASLIFHSLAARYAEVLQQVRALTGKTLRKLYIVGGAAQNDFLNRLTEAATGCRVCAGPAESATIGNFAVQLASLYRAMDPEIGASSTDVAYFAGQLGLDGPGQ